MLRDFKLLCLTISIDLELPLLPPSDELNTLMTWGTKEFLSLSPSLWEKEPEQASLVAYDSMQRMTGTVQNVQQFGKCSLLCNCHQNCSWVWFGLPRVYDQLFSL